MAFKYDIPNRPLCPKCNTRPRKFNRFLKDGITPSFDRYCTRCGPHNAKERERYKKGKTSKQKRYGETIMQEKLATLTCITCGFKAQDPCQLDIDHIDGNGNNNDPDNLQILCANCHRLKTKINKDGILHSLLEED